MKTENVIKLGVQDALKDAQFQRKASVWYRDLEETVTVVDVQKSNFGEQYYINLGVLVKNVPPTHGAKVPPKENQCHIRVRIEALKPNEAEHLKRILDLEDTSISAIERRHATARAIADIALPFLIQCSTRASIRHAAAQGRLVPALVHKNIRDTILS